MRHKLYVLIAFLMLGFQYLYSQNADPAITGAAFQFDNTTVGGTSTLSISFVNAGFTEIPSNSIEVTISTPIHYSSDGVSGPSGPGADFFSWAYIGDDIWRGLNDQSIPAFGGGAIILQVMGLMNSTSFEASNLNVQPVANFNAFSDAPGNNNLQPGLKVQGGALPVTWMSFEVSDKKDFHEINWKVEQEVNVSHYEVFRSVRGTSNFESIAKIDHNAALSGNYMLIDKDISLNGRYYYKIKQVDLNGTFEFSNIKTVFRVESDILFKAYPNPTNSFVKIFGDYKTDSKYDIHVLSADGATVEILADQYILGEYTYDLKDMHNGVYYIVIYNNKTIISKHKIFKI